MWSDAHVSTNVYMLAVFILLSFFVIVLWNLTSLCNKCNKKQETYQLLLLDKYICIIFCLLLYIAITGAAITIHFEIILSELFWYTSATFNFFSFEISSSKKSDSFIHLTELTAYILLPFSATCWFKEASKIKS